MTRARKAKKYPPIYPPNSRLPRLAYSLLKHFGAGKTLESYPWDPGGPDEKPPIDEVMEALKQIVRGDDARVVLGQAQGRGGNRKSNTRPIDIAVEYWKARNSKMSKADACTAVRAKLEISISDATIEKHARNERATVRERQERMHDFDHARLRRRRL